MPGMIEGHHNLFSTHTQQGSRGYGWSEMEGAGKSLETVQAGAVDTELLS